MLYLKHSVIIRSISIVVISFFLWTFGGVCDLAYAVEKISKETQKSKIQSSKSKQQRPEEKFQQTVEEIEQIISDAGVEAFTAKGIDVRKKNLKTKETEIESLDKEIKEQFAETEKKLKEAKLPQEVLQRHYKFVKHYEDNLKELKANINSIHQAKDRNEIDQGINKTKTHLQRVRPPKKHKALDPNKLPHRTAQPIKKEPRLKQEDFDKEFKTHKAENNPSQSPLAKGGLMGGHHAFTSGIMDRGSVLVASSGSLDGLLNGTSLETTPPVSSPWQGENGRGAIALLNPESFLLAKADPPTAADLAETIEVKFTPEIVSKAEELGKDPVKIYNWVRNNIEFEPYYGSLKGAQQTLLERSGNDFDQASLLIALLRASNIPSRYIYGTVELPIEKLMNWVGGVTDPNTAATILATAGVPGQLLTEGGQIKYAQMEHCWVAVYVPYGNYRGAKRDDSIKTWIPLDPSFKQYKYKRGMDLYSAMGIDGEQYIMDYITDTSPSPIPVDLQELFPNYSISPYQFYSKKLLNYIDTNFPDLTIEDVIGDETIDLTKTIIKKEYPYIIGSLPYKVVINGTAYSSVPDSYRHSIGFSIENTTTYEIDLSYAVPIPEIAGKRITMSYIPASSADEALVNQYGGNILNVPPYLLNVKPVFKANGIIIATGNPVGLGYNQTFYMTFKIPNKGADVITNKVTAGDYSAISIQYYKTPVDVVSEKMQTLTNNVGSKDLDDLLGQMLYSIGLSYMHHLNFEEELYAKNFQMIITKEPSEAITTSPAITEWLWGMPYKVTEGGVAIDVDRNIRTSFSIDGNEQRKKDFMIVSGLGSSAWEDRILESFFNIPSVSAARLLKIAHQQGVPIYTIESSNIDSILPQLQVTSEIINDIKNSINAGKKVIVSKTGVTFNDWNGVGYIVIDPVKGSGAYMISGGLAGGGTSTGQMIRELSSWSRDGSGFITIFTRIAVVWLAIFEMDTPYVWGAESPECGFDCSGFVHYIFTAVYGKNVFGGDRLSASGQHSYLKNKKMTYPYEERLPGDILWSNGYGHTGIYLGNDRVIHASGKPCKGPNDPKGWLPAETIPPECKPVADTQVKICGKYKKIIITPVNDSWFAYNGGLASDIGRPLP